MDINNQNSANSVSPQGIEVESTICAISTAPGVGGIAGNGRRLYEVVADLKMTSQI